MRDPQSLHKYLYVHGDPIQGVDPTGQFFAVAGLAVGFAIGRSTQSNYNAALVGASVGILADLSYLTWRMGIGANDLTLNAGRGAGQLHHSVHSVRISFPSGTNMNAKLDDIYADLRDFKHFNDGVNDIATVRTDTISDTRYAFFYSIGVFGASSLIINPMEVPVRLWSDISDRTVYADTAGQHMLVGQRRWSVRLVSGNTVEVRTETYDRDRDFLNRMGVSALRDVLGIDVQANIWTQYLTNIADYHSAIDGASSPGATVEVDEWLGGQPNPWLPADPYPGREVP